LKLLNAARAAIVGGSEISLRLLPKSVYGSSVSTDEGGGANYIILFALSLKVAACLIITSSIMSFIPYTYIKTHETKEYAVFLYQNTDEIMGE